MRLSFRQSTAILSRYLHPVRGKMALLALLILAGLGLQLLNPQIMRGFIDAVQAGGEMDFLTRAALLYLAVALVQQVVAVLSAYISENVGWTATNFLRVDLAEHCLGLDLSFHNAHTPGEMIERIDGDVTALSTFFSTFIIQILGNGLLLVGILVLLFGEDPRVGLSLAAFALLALFVLARLRNLGIPYFAAERQASAELFGFLEERLAGTEDIRANGAKAYVMGRFYRLMRQMLQRALKAGLVVNVLLNALFVLFAIGNAAAFAIGAYLFERQAVSLGTVYLIFQYSTMLQRPIEEITRQLQDLQKAGAGLLRVQELLKIRSRLPSPLGRAPLDPPLPEVAEGLYPGSAPLTQVEEEPAQPSPLPSLEERPVQPNSPPSPSEEGLAQPISPLPLVGEGPGEREGLALEFDRVTFGYHEGEDTEPVLKQVSFRLEAGQVLGLLGRTGSGKTSLTRLVFRLFDPDSGAVRLGPPSAGLVDLRSLPITVLRSQIGVITQAIQLFNASVRDNLTFFDPQVPDEKILAALRDLGLWDWYQSLPSGLDTELESGGGGLSAGQAQLLAFGRIFLRDPRLVILDEASSRLDPATEHWIETAIDRLVQGRTAIIVAHRLRTVQRADAILILERGQVLEWGLRRDLAANSGSHFNRLLQTGLEEVLA